MTENFIFKAMFVSLAIHTAILCAAYFKSINDPRLKAVRHDIVEISYRKTHKRNLDIREYPIKPSQRLDLSNDQKFLSNAVVSSGLVKEKSMLPFGMSYERKPEHMHVMELSRKISIMPITSAKINNPVFAAYNEMVHDRIKEKAGDNYDRLEVGEVFLAFIIDRQGVLRDVRILPEKTNASQHLQESAVKSLRAASPFPPFYKGMTLSEYPLEIEIQYQVND